jgi:Holliday junction resolvase
MSQGESRLSRQIMAMIRERGGFCFKVAASEQMMVGLPDIIICYKGYFLAFETKMPEGRVSEMQAYRHKLIRRAEGFVLVPRSVAEARAALDRIDVAIAADEASQAN